MAEAAEKIPVRVAPGPVEIFCEYYGCRILAAMCAARQAQNRRKLWGGIVRRIPYDAYCASGKCAQGAAVAEAVEKGEYGMEQGKGVVRAVAERSRSHREDAGDIGGQPAVKRRGRPPGPRPAAKTRKPAAEAEDGPSGLSSATPTPTEAAAVMPPGFELVVSEASRGCQGLFVSIRGNGMRFSKSLLDRVGGPDRVQIYYNRETRQVGFLFGRSGCKITREHGSGKITSAPAVRAIGVDPKNRVGVEVLEGGVVVTKRGEL